MTQELVRVRLIVVVKLCTSSYLVLQGVVGWAPYFEVK
jgi:hypothetical protein